MNANINWGDNMRTWETSAYQLGYIQGLKGMHYTRSEAELYISLRNTYETDCYLLGQDEGFRIYTTELKGIRK